MDFPSDLYYTGEHEWARLDDNVATIGITDYAQGELGDIVFIELPQKGDSVLTGDAFGTIEAVKAVSELYSPLDGEIVDVNTELDDTPELINNSPYEDGWMIKIRMSDPSQKDNLLSAEDYKKLIDES
jgi:glycine cleavage system H protein